MKNAFDTSGPSVFFSSKADRRKFAARAPTGGNLPPIVLPGTPKHPPPGMMESKIDRKK